MPEMNEDEAKALQEKLKNMSPEELREFQKKQCIFCHIISGKVQSKKVYEDEVCVGILDINPANPGHILLLPKEHYAIMPQIPEKEMQHMAVVVKMLSNALLKSLGAQGTNVIVANGVAAGQKAQHFMVHVIPRRNNDGVKFSMPQKEIAEKDLKMIQKKLVEHLGKVMGTEPVGKPEKKAAESKPEEDAEPSVQGVDLDTIADLLTENGKK